MSDEVEYKFVRGQGWIPERVEPKPTYQDFTTTTSWNALGAIRYFVDDSYWSSQLEQYWSSMSLTRVAPPPRTTQEPMRYFRGSNTPPEENTEESIHERRMREFREATRRFSRR